MNDEANLFAELGAVVDKANSRGTSWAKIYGVVCTLRKVAETQLEAEVKRAWDTLGPVEKDSD